MLPAKNPSPAVWLCSQVLATLLPLCSDASDKARASALRAVGCVAELGPLEDVPGLVQALKPALARPAGLLCLHLPRVLAIKLFVDFRVGLGLRWVLLNYNVAFPVWLWLSAVQGGQGVTWCERCAKLIPGD